MSLEDLSPEERLKLKKEIATELGVVVDAAGQVVEEPQVGVVTETVYTNLTDSDLTISDLGIKSGDDFNAVFFKPWETRDLAVVYKPREIRASKHLIMAVENGLLAKGRVSVDTLKSKRDQVAKLTELNEGMPPNTTFTDPAPLPLGGNYQPGKQYGTVYDQKLAELEQRDIDEDRETRKSAR